ncbi:hypothetical protein GZ77_20430 [Endozoicomonas montiporae]|uniref:Uncharacterized protein n=1 Tax=Endozoicomonas montiporae TaxID=1027273 RepID=A0A081N2Z8_9GAMM|nr:hypothetical protein GZ77_20430 [Endozoicomonas montiporae]
MKRMELPDFKNVVWKKTFMDGYRIFHYVDKGFISVSGCGWRSSLNFGMCDSSSNTEINDRI